MLSCAVFFQMNRGLHRLVEMMSRIYMTIDISKENLFIKKKKKKNTHTQLKNYAFSLNRGIHIYKKTCIRNATISVN